MKVCPACNKRKPAEGYNWKYKAKGIRSATCRECTRLYLRNHYKNNVEYYVNKARRRNNPYRKEISRKVFEYLSSHPCVDCGETDPVVLEFDHIEKKSKKAAVSEMVSRLCSWDTVLREIAKCEVRCANCHRRRTAKQQGWHRYTTTAHDIN